LPKGSNATAVFTGNAAGTTCSSPGVTKQLATSSAASVVPVAAAATLALVGVRRLARKNRLSLARVMT
jgi:hypothetical protein